jgi:hypothetical protein
MNDSVSVPSSAGASAASTAVNSPSLSRRTRMTGWICKWMPAPWALSSIVVESTRNGMSSPTSSTTVCEDRHPCCSNSGLKTRTLAVPGLRWRAKLQCASPAP